MKDFWISLQGIPHSGTTKVYVDGEIWSALFKEFDLPYHIDGTIKASVSIYPQESGVIFKGTVAGRLLMPCNRCSEDAHIALNSSFDSFEPFPEGSLQQEDQGLAAEADQAVIRMSPKGFGVEVNPLALAWQELNLSLPIKPLCGDECKGLCTFCGINLNTGTCQCRENQGDLRLAPLRGLRLKK